MSGVINKGTTYADSGAVTSTNLNAHVDDATFKAAAVDGVSTALNTSTPPAITIKDGGVSTTKLADSAVSTVKIASTAVSTAKLANDSVTGAKIADDVALAGNPTTTTQSAGNNTTRIATTAFVKTEIPNAFTPSTYTGGGSVTLPNGLIMKFGSLSTNSEPAGTFTATFADAFPNATIVNAQITPVLNVASTQSDVLCHLRSVSSTSISVWKGSLTNISTIYYTVIGR